MNKLLIIVFLGLAATQVLSVVNTTVSEKWSVVPSVAINSNETLLKNTETLGSAITINDNSTNNTNVTTITLAVPRRDSGNLFYVERTLLSNANTAIQRSGNADSTKKALEGANIVPTTILSQNGTLSFATQSQDLTNLGFFSVEGSETEWKPTPFSKPEGTKNVDVVAYWSPADPRAAYKATTGNVTNLYVANGTKNVAIHNLTSNVSEPNVDVSTVSVDSKFFNTSLPDNQVNQTINQTYQGASIDTNATTVSSVACANDLTTNETGAVVCYIGLSTFVTTVTVNQTFISNTTYFTDNSTTTLISSPDNSNITNTTSYTFNSLVYVRASLDNQNVTYTKNLTGAINAYKQLAAQFFLVTKSDNTTALVYHVFEKVNETDPLAGIQVVAIKALNGDSDSAKTIKDNKDLKMIVAVSVESYFGGLVVFYGQQKDYDISTLYATVKSDLSVTDTQTLLVNNTFFRSFKSNSSEIFGVYGNATLVGGDDTDAVFVGKIFDVSDFASSIQTVFGFAAVILAAVFAL